MSPDTAVVSSMPVPMGVRADTGDVHGPLTDADLHHISGDSPAALARTQSGRRLAVDASVDDPTDLTQTGWGVLCPSDIDPAIKAALQPLLDWRRDQVGNDTLFRVFDGANGVRPGQPVGSWISNRGVSLVAPVSPSKGVPYYLLIVGPPSRIPFEFQQQLDLQWAVGRLDFDHPEDYAAYARKVVEYEQGRASKRKRTAAVWMPRNANDVATPMLAGAIGENFCGRAGEGDDPLGQRFKFRLTTFIGPGEATKANLTAILRGALADGPPSVLFTGSHGAEWPLDDPDVQRARQGALVTQEWTRGKPLEPPQYFAGTDIPEDAAVHGLIVFVFACFGGGCPDRDSYYFAPDGSPITLAPQPFVGALPKGLLRRGALAVIAHVDRAFSYGFEDVTGTSQPQVIRTPIELLMKGKRVGFAADPLNLVWSSLAAQLGVALAGNLPGRPNPPTPIIANLYIARDDARNYIVLGDPAVALRSDAME